MVARLATEVARRRSIELAVALVSLWSIGGPASAGAQSEPSTDRRERYRRSTVRVAAMSLPTCRPGDGSPHERCRLGIDHGSGFAFTPSRADDGRIWVATHRDVVDRARAVAVQFSGRARRIPADVKYVDDTYDVALLGLRLPDDEGYERPDVVDGSVLSKRLLSPDDCQPPRVMDVPSLEVSTPLQVAGFPYEPDRADARIVEHTYTGCYSSAAGHAYLQTESRPGDGDRGGPVFDDEGRLLGLVVPGPDADDASGFVLPSGAVVQVTSEYDRDAWTWRPATRNERAYRALARATVDYLAFRHRQASGATEAAGRALRSALRRVTEARTADSTHADSCLLWAGLLWERMARSIGDTSRKYATAALEAVRQAKRHGETFDDGTHRFIEAVEATREASRVRRSQTSSEDDETASNETDDDSKANAPRSEPPRYLEAHVEIGANSMDGELRYYRGRIRVFVWKRWLTARLGYEQRNHLIDRHTDDILVDYVTVGVGTAPRFGDDWSLSASSGFLGLGSTSFLGGYLDVGVQYDATHAVSIVLETESKLSRTPDSFWSPQLGELYPGIGGGIDDVASYARPSTLHPQTSATLELHYDDARLDGYVGYHVWRPTTRRHAGGGLFYDHPIVQGGAVFETDHFQYGDGVPVDSRTRRGAGPSLRVEAGYLAVTADYRYWWGRRGGDEHAVDVGVEFEL